MRFHTFPVLFGLVTCVVMSRPAGAAPHQGLECMPHNGADMGDIGYDGWGVHNGSSVPRLVHCAGARGANLSWGTLQVTVYDRSTTDDVRCTIVLTDRTGVGQFSTVVSSSSSGSSAQVLSASLPGIAAYIDMECWLPAPTASGFSYVTTYDTP